MTREAIIYGRLYCYCVSGLHQLMQAQLSAW
jgi:hypothetical protein